MSTQYKITKQRERNHSEEESTETTHSRVRPKRISGIRIFKMFKGGDIKNVR